MSEVSPRRAMQTLIRRYEQQLASWRAAADARIHPGLRQQLAGLCAHLRAMLREVD